MKLAVLADLHGILPALEAVLEDCRRRRVDRVLVAGDLTRGPDDNAVVHLLQTERVLAIRGNADEDLLQLTGGNAPEPWQQLRQYASALWCAVRLEERTATYLRDLPEQQAVHLPGVDGLRLVHGSPRNPDELLYPERDPVALQIALQQVKEPVLVCGHTHLSWHLRVGGRLALNPGSVGLSTEGSPDARYALLTWTSGGWEVEQRLVAVDTAEIRRRFHDSGFLEGGGTFARALMLSAVTGKDVTMHLVRHARAAARAAGVIDMDAIPDAVWDRAERSFDWDVE